MMAGSSRSIYSQAFNFQSFIQKGVDPRTGQYTYDIDLYEVPDRVRNCPPFKLNLFHNPLNTEDSGLGKGWSFRLPCYEYHGGRDGGRAIFSTGETYIATESSGAIVSDQKLKSSKIERLAEGSYRFVYKSGQVEVLSNFDRPREKAVLVELYSHFGRSLTFHWTETGGPPRLEKIAQASDTLVKINYGHDRAEIITAPDTPEACKYILFLETDGSLARIELPLVGSLKWVFEYEFFGSTAHLKHVADPSGLAEQIEYQEVGHRLPLGAPMGTISYVVSHIASPSVGQPSIKTNYRYSDSNFLGWGTFPDWKDSEDNLFATFGNYKYTTTINIEGGAETIYTYNKFHLLVEWQRYMNQKWITQLFTYYAEPSKVYKDQCAQYQLPKSIQTIYYDQASNQAQTKGSSYVFDEWGNPLQDIQTNGIKTDRVYYHAQGEKGCPEDLHGFRRYLKTQTLTPADSRFPAPIRAMAFSYCQIPCAEDAQVPYFVAVQKQETFVEGEVRASTEYTYVDQPTSQNHGRPRQETTQLTGQSPLTKEWIYTLLEHDRFQETVTTKSFDKYASTTEIVSSTNSGLTVALRDEAGQFARFSYDVIGRLTSTTAAATTPYERETRIEYSSLKDGSRYVKTVTDTQGLQTRYSLDGLGRLCEVEKQIVVDGPLRLIQENAYNSQGRLAAVTDVDWLIVPGSQELVEQHTTRSWEYNDWGNPFKATDSSGRVFLSEADPTIQTRIESVESRGVIKTRLNEFGVPCEAILHNNDQEQTPYSKFTFEHDGLGRLVCQKDALDHMTEHRYDLFDRIVETIGPEGRTVKRSYTADKTNNLPVLIRCNDVVVGAQSYDGLDRVTEKDTASGKTTQAYQGVSPKPFEIRTADGIVSSLEYEPALNFAPTRVSYGGVIDTSRYSKTGALIQSRSSASTRDLEYAASGQLKREKFSFEDGQRFSASYVYSMAGKLQRYEDVHGNEHEMYYDGFGRLQSFVQGMVKVGLTYDKAGHVSTMIQEDKATNAKLVTSLTHDDFGREIKRSVKGGDGETTVFDLTKTYNELGLVVRRVKESDQVILQDESFGYDAYNRLIRYQCQGTDVPTDHNGKAIQEQIFAFDEQDNIVRFEARYQDGQSNTETRLFSLENPTRLTQITNTHPDLATSIELTYNANGALTQDDQGRRLDYDGAGRLEAVRRADGSLLARYRYDGSGRLICQQIPDQPDTHLFYRNNSLVAVKKGEEMTSYLSDGHEYWGQKVTGTNIPAETDLWVLDDQKSVLAALSGLEPNQVRHEKYTPYCFSTLGSSSPSIGFNGQWRDPVTGWYHLGNGYRVFNPVLMRFHTPDSWAPFTTGEINAYAYCMGDPVNRVDPSGHFSLFGWQVDLSWKDIAMFAVGTAASIAVGVLTGGASLVVQAAVGIAVGTALEVGGGLVEKAIKGEQVTWEGVVDDAVNGFVGGVLGEAGGAAFRAVGKGFKPVPGIVNRMKPKIPGPKVHVPKAKVWAGIAKDQTIGSVESFLGSHHIGAHLGSPSDWIAKAKPNEDHYEMLNPNRQSIPYFVFG